MKTAGAARPRAADASGQAGLARRGAAHKVPAVSGVDWLILVFTVLLALYG